MQLAELGMHGGTAQRAFKLKGEDVRHGDPITAEMLEGLSPRHIRALEGSGLVKYFNKASDDSSMPVKSKRKKKSKKEKH